MKKKTLILPCILTLFLAASLVWGAAALWRVWFLLPYCVEADCRKREIDIDTIKQWEKAEVHGPLKLLRLAGWRIEEQQQISSVSTGRTQISPVIRVYGDMELADTADLVCGRCGLAVEADFCVLSEALARDLFGSVQVIGEWVQIGKEKRTVAGVIRKEGKLLLMPLKRGTVQYLAVELEGRSRARERVERLIGEPF